MMNDVCFTPEKLVIQLFDNSLITALRYHHSKKLFCINDVESNTTLDVEGPLNIKEGKIFSLNTDDCERSITFFVKKEKDYYLFYQSYFAAKHSLQSIKYSFKTIPSKPEKCTCLSQPWKGSVVDP